MSFPFHITVTFNRGTFCEHSKGHQCEECFLAAIRANPCSVDVETMIREELVRTRRGVLGVIVMGTATVVE